MNLEPLDAIKKRASEPPGELLNPDGPHFDRWVMNGLRFLVGEVQAARDDVLALCAEVERLKTLVAEAERHKTSSHDWEDDKIEAVWVCRKCYAAIQYGNAGADSVEFPTGKCEVKT